MTTASTKRSYQKMSGFATPTGPMYEVKMAALLYLRGLNSGVDFQLATNVAYAGALDDVVFRYQPPGKEGRWITCFIQAKHTTRSTLMLEMLTSESSDFSLPKYFEANKKIEETMSTAHGGVLFGGDIEDCVYVLLTNCKANARLADASVALPGVLAGFLSSESGHVLHFDPDGEREAEKRVMTSLSERDEGDVRAFLGRLFVLCGQPNESGVGGLITAELDKLERVNKTGVNIDRLREVLVEGFVHWHRSEKCILDGDSDIFGLARDRVFAEESFHQERSCFNIDVTFENSNLKDLQMGLQKNLSLLLLECSESSCRLSGNKLFQAFDEPYLYSSFETFHTRQSAMTHKWRTSTMKFLVLSVNKLTNPTKLESIIDTLKQVHEIAVKSSKQLVVLSGLDSGLGLAEKLGDALTNGFVRIQDRFEFAQLAESCQTSILGNAVTHQGYSTTVSQLCGCEHSDVALDGQSVIDIVDNGGQIAIGPDLIDGIAYYIPRFAERYKTLSDSMLQGDLQESVAISVSSVEDIKTLLMRSDKLLSEKDVDECVSKFSRTDCALDSEQNVVTVGEQFVLGRKECNLVRLSDWENNRLPTLRVHSRENPSKACILFVPNETSEKDAGTLAEFHNVKHFFRMVEQTLEWSCSLGGDMNVVRTHIDHTNATVLDQKHLSSLDERLVLVAAEPGMGKTTLMANLAKQEKVNNPSVWAIAITLSEQTALLAQNHHEDVVEFLAKASGITLALHKTLFRFALEVSGNVVVLLDGFDEVTPTYVKECYLLFANLLKTKAKKIWVTSRNVFQSQLEENLLTLAVRLRKFDESDQANFFKGFWYDARIANSSTALPEEMVNELIAKLIAVMSRDLRETEKEMLGIPLQTRMMAEIYQDHVIYGAKDVPSFKRMNLLQLVEAFVSKKVSLYLARQRVSVTDVDYKSRLEKAIKDSDKTHMTAALIAFFNADDVKRFLFKSTKTSSQKFLAAIKRGEYKIGIIETVVDDKPRFMHRLFIEFFVAKWLAKNFQRHRQFLERTLYTTEFRTVRNIFDRILATDCPLHNAVLNEDLEAVQLLIDVNNVDVNAMDLGGRTALHLAAAYGTRKIQKENNDQIEIMFKILDKSFTLTNVHDSVFKSQPYRYADLTQSWALIEFLLPDRNDIKTSTIRLTNPEDQTRLECIFTHDLPQLMGLVLDSGLPLEHTLDGTSQRIISRACHRNSERVVRVLVERNVNLNRLDHEDESPLHISARRAAFFVRCIFTKDLALLNARDKYGRTALQLAALHGRFETVSALLDLGADMTLRDDLYGSTVLHYAAIAVEDFGVIVRFLLSKLQRAELRQFLETRTKAGDTALHWAAQHGCLQSVNWLLFYSDGQVSQLNDDDETPLMEAARSGHAEVAKCLIHCCRQDVKSYIDMQDRQGLTALQHAAMDGHSDVVELLINSGSNIDHQDRFGETSLHLAVRNGHQKVVKVLLEAVNEVERPAFANLVDHFGKTAMTLVSAEGDNEMGDLLGSYGIDLSNSCNECSLPTSRTSTKDVENEIIKLITSDVSFDYKLLSLHEVAGNGLNNLVEKMIEVKDGTETVSYVNCVDKNGNTWLHWAATNLASADEGHSSAVELLVNTCPIGDLSDYVNSVNNFGDTALLLAVANPCLESVDLLVRAGSNLFHSNHSGKTALMVAAECGLLDIVKYILESVDGPAKEATSDNDKIGERLSNSPDKIKFINMRDEEGMTALHLAASEGNKDVVASLISHGANLRIKECDDGTPLHTAADNGNCDAVRVILEAVPDEHLSAYINTVNDYGNTALHLAACGDSLETVSLLIKSGNSVFSENDDKETPLCLAAMNGQLDVVKLLVEISNGVRPNAVGDTKVKSESLKCSSTIGYISNTNNDNETALSHAVVNGHSNVVKYLIAQGALVNNNPVPFIKHLQEASRNGDADTVKVLLDTLQESDICNTETYNADDFNIDSYGYYRGTALYLAAEVGSVDTVSLIVEAGADVTIGDILKRTPLMVAAENGYLDVVKYLLDNCGAGKNGIGMLEYTRMCDKDGKTAVMLALEEEQIEVIRLIVRMLQDHAPSETGQ